MSAHTNDKTRKEKMEFARRFCRHGTCMFRVLGPAGEVWVCPKHGPRARVSQNGVVRYDHARVRALSDAAQARGAS